MKFNKDKFNDYQILQGGVAYTSNEDKWASPTFNQNELNGLV